MLKRIAAALGLATAAVIAVPPTTSPATQPTPVALTQAAVDEMNVIARTQSLKNWHLFVAVAPGEPGMFRFVLDVREEAVKADDDTFIDRGVRVSVDRASAVHLAGTVIDFKSDAAGKGFVFRHEKLGNK